MSLGRITVNLIEIDNFNKLITLRKLLMSMMGVSTDIPNQPSISYIYYCFFF